MKTILNFGVHIGELFHLYQLTNKNGMQVSITELGAIITSIKIPVHGELRECVLGFDSIEDYFKDNYRNAYPYLGAVIGRNAGRISKAHFRIENEYIQLNKNLGDHQLHGGFEGFDKKIWKINEAESNEQTVVLSYFSKDKEEGYPGNLQTKVCYSLNDSNELKVKFFAVSDKTTLVNLTQHTYFNLNSELDSDIKSHQLQISSNNHVELDVDLFPSGTIKQVKSTQFDYNMPKQPDENLDISFVLDENNKIAGKITSSDKKLSMEVETNQPILHIYTGYFLPNISPKNRKTIKQNAGICFETQSYADAPNHNFATNNLLNPGEIYHYSSIFRFTEN